jgi:hypothetical protein
MQNGRPAARAFRAPNTTRARAAVETDLVLTYGFNEQARAHLFSPATCAAVACSTSAWHLVLSRHALQPSGYRGAFYERARVSRARNCGTSRRPERACVFNAERGSECERRGQSVPCIHASRECRESLRCCQRRTRGRQWRRAWRPAKRPRRRRRQKGQRHLPQLTPRRPRRRLRHGSQRGVRARVQPLRPPRPTGLLPRRRMARHRMARLRAATWRRHALGSRSGAASRQPLRGRSWTLGCGLCHPLRLRGFESALQCLRMHAWCLLVHTAVAPSRACAHPLKREWPRGIRTAPACSRWPEAQWALLRCRSLALVYVVCRRGVARVTICACLRHRQSLQLRQQSSFGGPCLGFALDVHLH